jgi:exopolyphosphatase/guanosine-5'-triphosphate,3'-diphosphate pyrophosphatase
LLVTEEVAGKIKVIRQEVKETRLGEGFREGELTSASISRTLDVLEQWKKELVLEGIENATIFATSAVRDASNRDEFVQLVKNRTGENLRVLSGEEEAWYSFTGAVGGFDFPKENCLLIDIGGGSTEIAGFENGKLNGFSMPFGAVRWKVMAYRHFDVKRAMSTQITLRNFDQIDHFIGVGGTITTAGAVLNSVTEYTRESIHGYALDYQTLQALKGRLSAMTLEERKQVTGMPEARADIILYGLEILEILFEILNMPQLYISDWGILDGILADTE